MATVRADKRKIERSHPLGAELTAAGALEIVPEIRGRTLGPSS